MNIFSKNIQYLFEKSAWHFVQQVQTLLSERQSVTIGIAGGRSINNFLDSLSKWDNIPWQRIHLFMVDERLVPLNHPDSNYGQLIDKIQKAMNGINLHPFINENGNEMRAINAYGRRLQKISNGFDIVILSAGEDGHVGSLFPNHASVGDETLDFILVENSPKPPSRRMSASKTLLEASGCGFLFFLGNEKKAAWKKFSSPGTKLNDCPAKIITKLKSQYMITNLS